MKAGVAIGTIVSFCEIAYSVERTFRGELAGRTDGQQRE